MSRRAHVVGGWLRIPYAGKSTAKVLLTIDGSHPLRAWYDKEGDGAWVQVKVPEGVEGKKGVAVHADGYTLGEWQVRF